MKQAIKRIYDLLLGCPHGNISRPFTLHGRTYCVCCDCGREFAYSLECMSIIGGDHRKGKVPDFAMLHSH